MILVLMKRQVGSSHKHGLMLLYLCISDKSTKMTLQFYTNRAKSKQTNKRTDRVCLMKQNAVQDEWLLSVEIFRILGTISTDPCWGCLIISEITNYSEDQSIKTTSKTFICWVILCNLLKLYGLLY
jgi:hypothetical protein